MANSIALFKKYIDKLDEVYKLESLTARLDSDDSASVQMNGAGEFIIQKMSVSGLADYDKANGYKNGSVTLTNETVAPTYDRGEKLSVDAEDNTDTAGLAFGKLSSVFLRESVVPEIDAVRFATYATNAGTKKGETLTAANVVAAISEGVTTMDDKEVTGGKTLFITPKLLQSIKDLDTTKSREVLSEFVEIVKVPSGRFNTQITTKTGGADGFGFSATGDAINFLIVEKSAVIQTTKHLVTKVFSPGENQDADAWAFCYRNKGIVDVYENKVDGIYCSYVG